VSLAAGTGYGGDAEGDRLSTIENLIGSAFDDVLIGSNSDNLLSGGAGADTFAFDADSGNDTITDFVSGQDRIDLSYLGFSDFDSVKDAITDTGDDLVLAISEQDSITLEGIENVDALAVEDFLI